MATLPAVPPYFDAPKLDAAMIQELQLHFDANLGWLTRSYAEAKVGVESESGLTYPQIGKNDGTGEHYNIRPDSEIEAYSFFEIDKAFEVNHGEDEVKYFFSVIFWANLQLMDPAKEYDFTSELVKDATDSLKQFASNILNVETRPENIFNKYSQVTQEQKQLLMKPYTAFKITFEIMDSYSDDCEGTPVDSCEQNTDRINNLPDSVKECVLDSVCPNSDPATAVLKDTAGNVISTTEIAPGDTEDITAPDAHAVLKDSAGATISTTDIKSNETKDITAPDGAVTVKNSANTTIDSGNVKSNGSAQFNISDSVVSNSDDSFSQNVPAETNYELADTRVRVYLDGVLSADQNIPTLKAGQSITIIP